MAACVAAVCAVAQNNWVIIVNELIPQFKLTDLLYCNLEIKHPYIDLLPVFYQDIIRTWFKLNKKFAAEEVDQNIINKSLWLNKDITINRKELLWDDWYKIDIQFIKDILHINGYFCTR